MNHDPGSNDPDRVREDVAGGSRCDRGHKIFDPFGHVPFLTFVLDGLVDGKKQGMENGDSFNIDFIPSVIGYVPV